MHFGLGLGLWLLGAVIILFYHSFTGAQGLSLCSSPSIFLVVSAWIRGLKQVIFPLCDLERPLCARGCEFPWLFFHSDFVDGVKWPWASGNGSLGRMRMGSTRLQKHGEKCELWEKQRQKANGFFPSCLFFWGELWKIKRRGGKAR